MHFLDDGERGGKVHNKPTQMGPSRSQRRFYTKWRRGRKTPARR